MTNSRYSFSAVLVKFGVSSKQSMRSTDLAHEESSLWFLLSKMKFKS